MEPEDLQAQVDMTAQQSTDAERLMLNIQMEMLDTHQKMLKTQQKMLKKWASIDFWITIIGLVFLIYLVFTLLASCHAL